MGRVQSNTFGLRAVKETALNTPPATGWFQLEPNGSPVFNAEIATVSRNPITPDRQGRKGTITDLDATVSFDTDLTMAEAYRFLPGFAYSKLTNGALDLAVASVAAAGEFRLGEAVDAAVRPRAPFNADYAALFYGVGFKSRENNGLWALTAALGSTAVLRAVRVAGQQQDASVVEADSTGILYRAGILLQATQAKAGAYAGTRYTLTTAGVDWSALGLTAGETVSLGGRYGRVVAANNGSLVLDQADAKLQAFQPAGNDVVPVLFGQFIRNVSADGDADYEESTFTLEGTYPNLGAGGAAEYKYGDGALCNQIVLNVPLTNKVTANLGFVATDIEPPSTNRKQGAADAVRVRRGTAYSSTSDVGRLRLAELDESGDSTYFKSLTLTINNNATAEKVIGTLGAIAQNAGDFQVTLEATLLLTSSAVPSAIRNNTSMALQLILHNDNGALVLDIPALTIGGGAEELPENQAITIAITGMAYPHPELDTSIGVSIHPFRMAA